MQYWLIKSEPDAFSIDDLQQAGVEPWDGIRNYQARNFMRDQMQIGDQVFFYHSSCATPGIVGICEVASEPYPDPTAFDPENNYYDPKSDPDKPRWILVDMKFVKKLDQLLSLKELKATPELEEMRLLRKGNRLSIMPVEKSEWDFIVGMTQ